MGGSGGLRPGLGLKARFALWLVLFVPAMMLAAYLYFSRHEQAALAGEILLRGRTICSGLASGAEEALVTGDDLALAKLVVDAKTRNPGVIFCSVTDSLGVIWAHTDLSLVGTPESVPPGARRKEGTSGDILEYRTKQGVEVFDIFHPVAVGGKAIGRARVAVSRESIRLAIARARRGLALVTLGIMILGLAWMLLMVSLVVGPLGRITADIEAIGNGDLDRQIKTGRRDEVGKIALAARSMAAKLKVARERLIEQERIKRELQIARDIQTALLPAAVPARPGLRMASRYRAAAEVGGDYYDFIDAGRGRLGIVVADVSGKGVGGSMVMTMLRSIIRLEGARSGSPRELVGSVHAALRRDIPEDMFVTLFYALLEPEAGRLRCCCAGHNPAYLFRPKPERLLTLKPAGQPLGVSFADEGAFLERLKEETTEFKPGDVLVAYTDGVSEAVNPQGEQFGEIRLEAVIRGAGGKGPLALADELSARLDEFTAGRAQADDITFVVAQRTPMEKGS
jgi:serine phosphatase RsbU (regulator of sigma subunit)